MGEEFQFQTQLNAFVTIPYSKITETMLQKENVPHSVAGAEIVVHGNDSDRFADLLNMETRRTMDKGLLNPNEPQSLNMMRQIVESLLDSAEGAAEGVLHRAGGATRSRREPHLSRSHPAPDPGGQGLEVKSINEGLAVIYSELESSNYTGIGISCGGGLCNVCGGVSLGTGAELLDPARRAITSTPMPPPMTGERANRVRIAKEDSFHFNGFFADKLQQALSVYYDEMIQSLVQGMKQAFVELADVSQVAAAAADRAQRRNGAAGGIPRPV